jgi:DNA modification methylase
MKSSFKEGYANKILNGDALEHLKELPDECVNMVMTSPPYWALRDYNVEGQLGLEKTFEEYIKKLCDIFDEVKRVLRKDGTCWVNLGDTYYGSGKGAGGDIEGSKQVWTFKNKTKKKCGHCGKQFEGYAFQNFCGSACSGVDNTSRLKKGELQDKSLTLIPFRFAIEMVNRGWILRNTIIWHKPNAMPSSVKDRFNVDFEYLFFFSKSKKYYFETQYEPLSEGTSERYKYSYKDLTGNFTGLQRSKEITKRNMLDDSKGRNKRTVWSICPQPFAEAHFAVYPEELCETPIKAGCPIGGIVLDPFFGSGTTGVVALKQNKNFIGIELNPEYIKIANKRLKPLLEQEKLI